jgi:hypothetical protein
MKVRLLLLGLVGAVIGWLEPPPEDAAQLERRTGRISAPADAIHGSRANGYRSEGARFYTWQPERSAVVAWVEELSPFDRRGPTIPG